KLTRGGELTIRQTAWSGTGNPTQNVTGNITQGASGLITASGLQLLGSGGSVHLDDTANDVTTLAASYNGPISYRNQNALSVGIGSESFTAITHTRITSRSPPLTLKT